MNPVFLAIVHAPAAHAALTGALAAASIDFNAFRMWKTWNDASTYSWSVALFRWAQGAVVGLVGFYGFGL